MQDCQVCGRSFDPLAFQVVVPELGRGFDRVECAESAQTLVAPDEKALPAPLVAIVQPVGAAVAPAAFSAQVFRAAGAPVAMLAVLAAGTAAAAYLWLHVVDADTTAFPFLREAAPPALGHETVHAHVRQAPRTEAQPAGQPSQTAPPARSAPAAPSAPVPALNQTPTRPAGAGAPAPTRNVSSPRHRTVARESKPPASTSPARTVSIAERTTGKGHPKHGLGHYKHGETDGIHSPGHGLHGRHGHQGHRNGKGKRH